MLNLRPDLLPRNSLLTSLVNKVDHARERNILADVFLLFGNLDLSTIFLNNFPAQPESCHPSLTQLLHCHSTIDIDMSPPDGKIKR